MVPYVVWVIIATPYSQVRRAVLRMYPPPFSLSAPAISLPLPPGNAAESDGEGHLW